MDNKITLPNYLEPFRKEIENEPLKDRDGLISALDDIYGPQIPMCRWTRETGWIEFSQDRS